MKLSQLIRLIWIDDHLVQHGNIRRIDICRAFNISIPQASADIAAYRRKCSYNLLYDSSLKYYYRSNNVECFDKDTRESVTTLLKCCDKYWDH